MSQWTIEFPISDLRFVDSVNKTLFLLLYLRNLWLGTSIGLLKQNKYLGMIKKHTLISVSYFLYIFVLAIRYIVVPPYLHI